MLKAVIIEDEIKSLNNLKNQLAQHCPDVEILAEASNIEDGYEMISDLEEKPDLAFFDIDLPDGLIFTMLERLRPIDFEIIFVTGQSEHTLRACEFACIGYIMKPINPERLVDAVSRVRTNHPNRMDQRLEIFSNGLSNPNSFEKLSIAGVDGIYFVNLKDIIRFEAEDNYTHIYLQNGDRITASKTIKAYEDLLAPFNFYRVHKRHVINLNYMRKFVKGDGGYLIMDDNIKIEVSRRRRPAFMEQMKRLQEGL
ncbi:MAG: response regulator transcription factor [Saprospiraceae bacterium]|nr:response regulator transcription factor [Saprospiraceae bacterium]